MGVCCTSFRVKLFTCCTSFRVKTIYLQGRSGAREERGRREQGWRIRNNGHNKVCEASNKLRSFADFGSAASTKFHLQLGNTHANDIAHAQSFGSTLYSFRFRALVFSVAIATTTTTTTLLSRYGRWRHGRRKQRVPRENARSRGLWWCRGSK